MQRAIFAGIAFISGYNGAWAKTVTPKLPAIQVTE